jgi:hypothetical protein
VSYTFAVTARNAVGTGPASAPSNAVTPEAPITAPGAPTGVTATAGDASATVSWTAPASDGGSPITGYTVTSEPGGIQATTDGALAVTVTGLTNGERYRFRVTATNAAGTGPASGQSNQVTPDAPDTLPGAPVGVTAVAGDASAVVSWEAPADDGGTPITQYLVTSSPGVVATGTSGSARSIAVLGLTNGVAYTFTVTARNAVGSGPPSVPSDPVTPQAAP